MREVMEKARIAAFETAEKLGIDLSHLDATTIMFSFSKQTANDLVDEFDEERDISVNISNIDNLITDEESVEFFETINDDLEAEECDDKYNPDDPESPVVRVKVLENRHIVLSKTRYACHLQNEINKLSSDRNLRVSQASDFRNPHGKKLIK